ncbi:hypothetical protein M413DRAFT_449590 [Hebeloma cylindrosporum]|uniref:Uncharacterized protein n=1 Tax=Hebeloma cylindrosporum TaxID=76867 RepID=A0A0C3BWI5_HEBCY|nr:hypothetical protein M413DRAFT_449590 [Hebeloma cylindrosporum h7]
MSQVSGCEALKDPEIILISRGSWGQMHRTKGWKQNHSLRSAIRGPTEHNKRTSRHVVDSSRSRKPSTDGLTP